MGVVPTMALDTRALSDLMLQFVLHRVCSSSLCRLTPQKWAMSKLTTIFRLNIIVNDQNETYQDKGITSILTQTITSIHQMFEMFYVVGFTLA